MSAQANPMSAVTMRRVQRARPQRNHRMLAQCLRRTAKRTEPRHPLARQRETLLHDRVAAVRDDLRCIAAMLEHAPGIDPQCIAEIRDLLFNGCDSPLYNLEIHISELRATVYYIHSRLAERAAAVNANGG
jgi:hypothetical protein